MRSTAEQLSEIQRRRDCLLKEQARKRKISVDLIAAAVCVFLMAVTAFYLPSAAEASDYEVQQQYGSVILNAPHLGYVVIGVLAFLLGVFLTLFCFHLRRRNR